MGSGDREVRALIAEWRAERLYDRITEFLRVSDQQGDAGKLLAADLDAKPRTSAAVDALTDYFEEWAPTIEQNWAMLRQALIDDERATDLGICTMCENDLATTTWGFPVCQTCHDGLVGTQAMLEEMEAEDPALAEAGRRVEESFAGFRAEAAVVLAFVPLFRWAHQNGTSPTHPEEDQ